MEHQTWGANGEMTLWKYSRVTKPNIAMCVHRTVCAMEFDVGSFQLRNFVLF